MQIARVLVGEPHHAFDQLSVDACAQSDGGSVRPDDDVVTGSDAERPSVGRGQLDLPPGPLEAELGDAVDGRAREERAVALELQAAGQRDRIFKRGGSGQRAAQAIGSHERVSSGIVVRRPSERDGQTEWRSERDGSSNISTGHQGWHTPNLRHVC